MPLAVAVCALAVIFGCPNPQPPGAGAALPAAAESPDRAERWRQDLDFLAAELPKRHIAPFARCTEERWRSVIAEVRERLDKMSDAETIVAFRQVVAMLGDGHTVLGLDGQSTVPVFRVYPIACAWLSDGIYPAAVPREHLGLLGQKLTKVGGQPIETVVERLAAVQATDNVSGRKNQAMAALREAETLAALGLVADIDAADFTLADAEGKETTLTLAPLAREVSQGEAMAQKFDANSPGVGISRRSRRAPYGFERLSDGRVLYVWYDVCADRGEQTVAEFCSRTLEALDAGLKAEPPTIDRVVIDLRRNSGGNSVLFAPMIDGLARRDAIGQKGRLFALIGRRTYSSGMMNAWQLAAATECLLVGEPTGGTPNGFGEIKTLRLPNSKAVVQYSTKRFKGPKAGDAVMPDIGVEQDAARYFDPTSDVVLDAALQHRGDAATP